MAKTKVDIAYLSGKLKELVGEQVFMEPDSDPMIPYLVLFVEDEYVWLADRDMDEAWRFSLKDHIFSQKVVIG